MADDFKEAVDLEQKPAEREPDEDGWDWVRAAGVSREELLLAIERSGQALQSAARRRLG